MLFKTPAGAAEFDHEVIHDPRAVLGTVHRCSASPR